MHLIHRPYIRMEESAFHFVCFVIKKTISHLSFCDSGESNGFGNHIFYPCFIASCCVDLWHDALLSSLCSLDSSSSCLLYVDIYLLAEVIVFSPVIQLLCRLT